jgi:hypothetical protein
VDFVKEEGILHFCRTEKASENPYGNMR